MQGYRWAMCLVLGTALPGGLQATASFQSQPDAHNSVPQNLVGDDKHAAEPGLPFIRNFAPAEYAAAPQNWAIAQDRHGVIYVGNNADGVLAFDGTRWRPIAIPNRSTVRALAADESGRIFVGAVGELGYLAPDDSGAMHYMSLLDRFPPKERGFTDVRQVFPTDDGVYFLTDTRLFRLHGNQVTVWKSATSFHLAFWARGRLFVREVGRGLMQLVGARLVLVPGGERFATEKIYALLPWGEPAAMSGDLLIGTRTQGWLVFDGTHYRAWITEADAALKQDNLYGAIWLADGTLAVATLQGGVSLLDVNGRLLRHLTKATGLADDGVYALFQDRQRGLWLGLSTGIARIDLGSPITQYDERIGLEGTVEALQRYAGRMYVGTLHGLFRLDTDAEGAARFVPIPQVPGEIWDFLESDQSLLVATSHGVFEIGGDHIRRVRASEQASASLLRSEQDPARVFVGLQDGIASMRFENGRWIDEGRIPGISEEARALFEEPGGQLWLGNRDGSVIRLTFSRGWAGTNNTDDSSSARVERFGLQQGLSAGPNVVYPIDGKPRFVGLSGGILQFDERRRRFVSDPRFVALFPGGDRQIFPVQEDSRGHVWMATADRSSGLKETGAAIKGVDGITRWEPTPLQPISGSYISTIYGDTDGVMWFGGEKSLFRYDTGKSVTHDPRFTALVRKVEFPDGRIIFGGTGKSPVSEIDYAHNALRFEFAAPSYDTLEANRFQIRLDGLDRAWSAWNSEAYRDYTNLSEGNYRFRVRARNVYGIVSAEGTYAFSILPPWYRTWWAYLGFFTLIAATLLFLHKIRVMSLLSANAILRDRHRMAREIHDTVAQVITAASLQLEVARQQMASSPDRMDEQLRQAQSLLTAGVENLRRSIYALRAEVGTRSDLVKVLKRMIRHVTRNQPLKVDFVVEGTAYPLAEDVQRQLEMIGHEAVTNAVRHSRATNVVVRLQYEATRTILAIDDDGIGLPSSTEEPARGFGMTSMRERAASVSGWFTAEGIPGVGTRIAVTVPRALNSVDHR